jgi:hypothetical protein
MGPSLYEPVENLETPALLVNIDAMEQNIKEYAAFDDETVGPIYTRGNRATIGCHSLRSKNASIALS